MAVQFSENYRNINVFKNIFSSLFTILQIKSFYTRILKNKKRKSKSGPDLQELVDQIWEKDVDRIDESGNVLFYFLILLI